MKKMIVSLMLIMSMFAFAAESAPSATVGYVKYSNVTTTGADLNFIALPVSAGYATVGAIDPTGTNVGTISKWNAATQTWVGTTYNTTLSKWIGDYAAVNGQAYMLNMKNTWDLIVDGPVITMPTYNLITTTGSDLNFIMHPMTKVALATAGAIGSDIGTANVGTVSKWNAATQTWVGTTYNTTLSKWIGDYASTIANPLMLNMKAAVAAWPYTKDAPEGYDAVVESTEKSYPKGQPKDIYYEVVDAGSAWYDFSAAPYGGVTAKAWIEDTPAELQTTTAGTIFWYDIGGISCLYLNVGNFPTAWATNDILHCVAKDEDINIEGYATTLTLNIGDLSGYFAGPSLGGTDPAITVNTPSSIEENVPASTSLYQNYPNPFNPATTIKFDLASAGNVKLSVYNYNGQLVKSLVDGAMNAGHHSVNFDASSLSAGVYYYTMETAGKTMTQKMVLVK
jgi:hypothetical protein